MKVLLGVSGGVAAYKAAELLRRLQQHGIEVQVAMTRSAQRFVTPLTFEALSGKPVFTSLWESQDGKGESLEAIREIDHITVGQKIDALVVAPATANTIAKFAHGRADDFLSALYLAAKVPVIMAPAMNVNMWEHPATQENVLTLERRGVKILAPDSGYLACGMTGGGRLAEIDAIAEAVVQALTPRHDLAGETVLITAGGTREPLDPVRYLGNRSSGKMGHALAEAAVARGAQVVLVTASSLPDPAGCEVVRVVTASEMEQQTLVRLQRASVVIMAAAVADFRPRVVSASKLRRGEGMILELESTEDIVAKVVAQKPARATVIAFAAETEDLEANARAKLIRKGADAIVANDVSVEGLGFDSDSNAGLFLTASSTVMLPVSSKRAMADRVLDEAIGCRQTVAASEKKIFAFQEKVIV